MEEIARGQPRRYTLVVYQIVVSIFNSIRKVDPDTTLLLKYIHQV